jgi:signal transduction histidine kinase
MTDSRMGGNLPSAAPSEAMMRRPGGTMTGIATELSALADRLQSRHEAILQSWREQVKKDLEIPSNDPLSTRQLFDHIPAMLLKLQRELRSSGRDDTGSADASDEALAVAHGQQRWQQGYDLREVVRELGTLNECVVVEMDAYATSEHDISHHALASARRVWARMYATGIEESLGRYFELQKKEAAGRLEDLEQVLKSVRETEKDRIDLWQQAAHDLRGNLSVVANATVGLTHRELLEPTRDEFVRILMRNVTSLHQLLNDVTSLARLEAGREQPCIETIDVSAIMHHLCDGVRPLAQERRLFLRCEGTADFAARGDAVKIRRIAQNLILNAVRYTREGGITVYWGDSDPPDPKRWEIMIKDTGPGLHTGSDRLLAEALESTDEPPTQPAESLTIAPTPKPQTTPGRAGRGTEEHGEGIGLSIVKRLCDLLNATIQLETGEFEGTTFRILFPRS